MTTRLPDEPVRVTSWLAGWVDYVFATVLVAGRWLRLPVSEPEPDAGFRTAFAPTMGEGFGPRWHDEEPAQKSGPLVKAAEIIMLSISFFLAAHLLSGGTTTAVAPNLNRLLSEHPQAQTELIASVPRAEITVPAAAYADVLKPAVTAPDPVVTQESAALQPPASDNAAAAAVQEAPAPEPTRAPAAVDTAPPPPAPAAVAPPLPEPTVAAAPVGRYLTSAEVRAAVIAAGWPSSLVEEVVNVAWCESRFHSGAQYGGALGLMQMMPYWFTSAGLDPNQWSDPVTNMRAALFAYQEHERNHAEPWGPWTCKPDHGLDQPD